MTNGVSWLLCLSVHAGRGSEFRTLMEEMVEFTRGEQGTQCYEWFLSSDDRSCHLYERYRDSAACLVHMAGFGARFADRFLSCVAPASLSVYGEPSAELRAALDPFGAVYLAPFGGFRR